MKTKFLTGLFRSARKKLQLTHDNDMGAFREKLNAIVEQKDSISDEELKSKIEELKSMIADLPDGDDKAQLERFLDDFANVKEQDSNVAKEASKQVADLFEKLDTSAMQDTPENVGQDTDEVVSEAKEEDETEDEDAPAEEKDSETEDDDPNPNYSLEEIYQFIKKRMAEDSDAPAEDEACEESDETKDEDEEVEGEDVVEDDDEEKTAEEIAQDHAPRIAIKMTKDNAHRGGLYEMFEKIKRGER